MAFAPYEERVHSCSIFCLFLHSTQSNLYACTFLVSTQWMPREKNWCVLMVSSFLWGLQRFETVTLAPPKPFTVGWKSSYFLPVHFYDSHLFLLRFVNCKRVSFSLLSSEGLFALWNSVNLVALQPQLSDELKKLTVLLIIWLFLMFVIMDGEVLLLTLYKLSGNNPRVDCLTEPCCSPFFKSPFSVPPWLQGEASTPEPDLSDLWWSGPSPSYQP